VAKAEIGSYRMKNLWAKAIACFLALSLMGCNGGGGAAGGNSAGGQSGASDGAGAPSNGESGTGGPNSPAAPNSPSKTIEGTLSYFWNEILPSAIADDATISCKSICSDKSPTEAKCAGLYLVADDGSETLLCKTDLIGSSAPYKFNFDIPSGASLSSKKVIVRSDFGERRSSVVQVSNEARFVTSVDSSSTLLTPFQKLKDVSVESITLEKMVSYLEKVSVIPENSINKLSGDPEAKRKWEINLAQKLEQVIANQFKEVSNGIKDAFQPAASSSAPASSLNSFLSAAKAEADVINSEIGNDKDGDGYKPLQDCDDNNANVYRKVALYPDVDSDHFSDSSSPLSQCIGNTLPVGTMANRTDILDCDSNNPELQELKSLLPDEDLDGFAGTSEVQVCSKFNEIPSGYLGKGAAKDCDDKDARVGEIVTGSNQVCKFTPAIEAFLVEKDIEEDYNGRKMGSIRARLSHAPKSEVFVSVKTLDFGAIRVYDASKGTIVSEVNVKFTPRNWNSYQTINVFSVDDNSIEVNEQAGVSLQLQSTQDVHFQNLQVAKVLVPILDNDKAGIRVTTLGSPIAHEAQSGYGVLSFSVALTSQPTGNVTVSLDLSDLSEGLLTESGTIVFTPSNWNQAVTKSISPVWDSISDGDQPLAVNAKVTASADSNYSGIELANAANFTIKDRDIQSFMVINWEEDTGGQNFFTSEGGTETKMYIRLAARPVPGQDVIVNTVSTDTSEVTVISNGEIHFDSTNWDQLQTVILKGVNDDVADGYQTLKINVSSSSHPDIPVVQKEIANVESIAGSVCNVNDPEYSGPGPYQLAGKNNEKYKGLVFCGKDAPYLGATPLATFMSNCAAVNRGSILVSNPQLFCSSESKTEDLTYPLRYVETTTGYFTGNSLEVAGTVGSVIRNDTTEKYCAEKAPNATSITSSTIFESKASATYMPLWRYQSLSWQKVQGKVYVSKLQCNFVNYSWENIPQGTIDDPVIVEVRKLTGVTSVKWGPLGLSRLYKLEGKNSTSGAWTTIYSGEPNAPALYKWQDTVDSVATYSEYRVSAEVR